MKPSNSLLRRALLAAPFLMTPLLLRPASQLPCAIAAPGNKAAPAPVTNGFEKLFDAVAFTSKADTIDSKLGDLTPAESFDQKRNVVSRNRRALVALREALLLPITHPPVRATSDDFGNYDGFRILGSILNQEADVRASNRDYFGAINSKLDCIELGVTMTRSGPLRAVLAGRDIEIIGRRDLTQWVPKLEDDQLKAVVARLERIESLRPPLLDVYSNGKSAAVALTKAAFDSGEWEDIIKTTKKLDGTSFTDDEQGTLQTIGLSEVIGGIDRTFSAGLASAASPYQPRKAATDYALDPWARLYAGAAAQPSLRVDYEAARVQDRMIVLALGLRAYRIENGVYPETFETAPDPFAGDKPLIYRRDGEGYKLYSIGPDAKDDGGQSVVIPTTGRIPADAKGDILAPVLAL